MDEKGREPWERRKHESSKAYAAFCHYRDTPPQMRSLRKCCAAYLGEGYTSKLRQWFRWCSKYSWVERVNAWEREQQRLVFLARQDMIQRMQERHALQARALQGKAITRLKDMDAGELTPQAVLRFFIEAAKLERVSQGIAETIQDITSGGKPIAGPVIYIPAVEKLPPAIKVPEEVTDEH